MTQQEAQKLIEVIRAADMVYAELPRGFFGSLFNTFTADMQIADLVLIGEAAQEAGLAHEISIGNTSAEVAVSTDRMRAHFDATLPKPKEEKKPATLDTLRAIADPGDEQPETADQLNEQRA